jgi:tRNA(Ser,Leu) C12 N-acetylase TAN1
MAEMIVVATSQPEGYKRAHELLSQFGEVIETDYYNLLILVPDDPAGFMDRLAEMVRSVPEVMEVLSRIMPSTEGFLFSDPEEFERKAREIVLGWTPRLRGKSFHVRMHRRGFKGRMSSQDEERFLDEALLAVLESEGKPGHIEFDDPDAVIDVETIDNRAALSFWTRADLERYPFLKVD